MAAGVGSSDYEVFINFRGEDARNIFVDDLYNALRRCGIYAFIDSKDLQKGEDIEKLLTIIKGVKLSIAVLSQKYVESKWCLKELTQMVECHRSNDQIIIPIFYKVEPSHVEHRTGCFQISSQRFSEKASEETLLRWKDALQVVGGKSGYVFKDGDDQLKLVEDVVKNALIQLDEIPLIKDRLQNNKTLLVLDDVDDRTQLNALARDLDWFDRGS